MEQDKSVTLDVSRPLFWVYFFGSFTKMKKERQNRTENNRFDSQSGLTEKFDIHSFRIWRSAIKSNSASTVCGRHVDRW